MAENLLKKVGNGAKALVSSNITMSRIKFLPISQPPAIRIQTLKFGKSSKVEWPGNVVLIHANDLC